MIAGPLDFTLVLFWTSLGISAAIVALFLWLMREEPPVDSDREPHPPDSKERTP